MRSPNSKKGRPPAPAAAAAAAAAKVGGWAELHEGLLLSVLDRLPSVADLCAFAAVCRSWRALANPPASAVIAGGRPPLLLSPVTYYGNWTYPRRCRLLSPAEPAASYRCLVRSGPLTSPGVGYSHGHLISCRGRRPLLVDIASGDVVQAPELPPDCRLQHGVLTAPLSAPDCSLLLLSHDRWTVGSVLLQWRVGGEMEWSEHPLEEDTDKHMNRITIFGGRILILDRRGRLFAVEFSPHFGVSELAVQWTQAHDVIELLECDGDLMLVRFANAHTISSVKLEVFRLDLPSWVKVETLGESALFVELEHGSSVSCPNPRRWGGRSNCIYLARRGCDAWTVLPLDGKPVVVYEKSTWPLHRANDTDLKWPSPVWVFPSMLY